MKNACLLINLSLLINVFANVFIIPLCKASVATIKFQSSVSSLQSQLFAFSPNPLQQQNFNCQLSVPSVTTIQLEVFSCKSSVPGLQSQAFLCNTSVSTGLLQAFVGNHLALTLQSQIVERIQLQHFSPKPSVPRLQLQPSSCNPSLSHNPSVAIRLSLQSQPLIPQFLVPSLHLQPVSVQRFQSQSLQLQPFSSNIQS